LALAIDNPSSQDYIDAYGIIPLTQGSAALQAGDYTLLPAGITTDQNGYTRPGATTCTPGAVEMFTVDFETNGGAPPVDDQILWGGAKVTEPDEITQSEYIFVDWYKESNFATIWDFDSDTVDGNTTLYARWNTGTGINPSVAGKAVQSVGYYDLTGKPVPAGAKGFVIKKTVYSDGSIGNSKTVVK
jgi:hypothetical protein